MQNGSLIRAERRRGPDVWEFRWREPGADGKRKHRRIVLGSVDQLADETAARQAIPALRLEFNRGGAWLKTRSTTVSDLVSHYRERELDPDTIWKTYSTKVTYEGYLDKWILPRWEKYPLVRVNAGEVELWLRSLTLARSSCAKIRNLMSVCSSRISRRRSTGRNLEISCAGSGESGLDPALVYAMNKTGRITPRIRLKKFILSLFRNGNIPNLCARCETRLKSRQHARVHFARAIR